MLLRAACSIDDDENAPKTPQEKELLVKSDGEDAGSPKPKAASPKEAHGKPKPKARLREKVESQRSLSQRTHTRTNRP